MPALQGGGEHRAQRAQKEGWDHGFFFLYWTLCRCHASLKVTLLNTYLKTDQDEGPDPELQTRSRKEWGRWAGGYSSNITKTQKTRILSSFTGHQGAGPWADPRCLWLHHSGSGTSKGLEGTAS